jgi:16S rRNA processing protein RimM
MNKTDYVIVGKIASTYGVQGWLKVVSYTESTYDIAEYTPWYVEESGSFKPIDVTEVREYGKGIIVKFAGYDNPEKAKLLTGKKIGILRSQLPALDKDEYYWSDLEGLTVINQNGVNLGQIVYLIETGSNDVLVVKGETEHAIPYLPNDVIISIDLANKIMRVDWELI